MCRLFFKCIQVLVACLAFIQLYAQNDTTRVLDEVVITGMNLSRFSSGTIIQRTDLGTNGALAEIGNTSTIHFKNYGNQQLSTIAFRGTSANHTNVVWNGLQVNSASLGQTDFSVWPAFLTDQVIIQRGGGSSLFGSGAIGGSVIIDNSRIQKDSTISIYSAHGSFGQWDLGLKAQLNLSQNITSVTKVFRGVIDNDFPLERGGRQPHAIVKRMGGSQQFTLVHQKGKIFSEVAFAENDRDIQPTITSSQRSGLITRELRAVVNHELDLAEGLFLTTAGFNSNKTIFNDSIRTSSYRFTINQSFEKSIFENLHFRVGGSFIHEWAVSENYSEVEMQNQTHAFTSWTFFPIRSLELTANLRATIQNENEVLIPSLGMNYGLLSSNDHLVNLRGQVSLDYRAPTFNDLFWRPGGIPSLRPESSKNYEAGIDWNYKKTQIRLTGFHSSIEDWIQWLPVEGVWTPRNVRKINTKGIESSIRSSGKIGQMAMTVYLEHTYVLSEDQGLEQENQLPYTPKHELIHQLTLGYRDYQLMLRGSLTSDRYATLTNSVPSRIDGFYLFDAAISRSLALSGMALNIKFSTQNLFNTNYQVVKNHAMPGRSFLIELSTKF